MSFQHPSVRMLFTNQKLNYARHDQEAVHSPIIPLFLMWEKTQKIKKIKICEFGGAAGQLLAEINKKSRNNSELLNVEIVKEYREYQVLKKIKFIEGSILNSKLKNNSFDSLIIRDVLHHLIGKNLRETRNNQLKALKELKRLVKPGGVIFVEELLNKSALASKIIYTLSKINSKIGFNVKVLEISPNTIVSFLTYKQLIENVKKIFGKKCLIKSKHLPYATNWRERLVHLGFEAEKVTLLINYHA